HETDGNDDRSNHYGKLTGHSQGRNDRIKGKDDVQQEDLNNYRAKVLSYTSGRHHFFTFQLFVDFHGAFPDQKQTSGDEDQVSTGNLVCRHLLEKKKKPHQPG